MAPFNFQCQSVRLSSPPFDLLSFDLSRKALHYKSLLLTYCTNARFFDYRAMSGASWFQHGEGPDFDWEDWIIEPTSEPTMGSEVG
jgi:hypothetical protein